jgi:uncharacterized protein YndB with AHSA1/START domain
MKSTSESFTYELYISTTPEKLWEALTIGDFTYQYWGGRRIESDWKVGSPLKHVREDGGVDFQGEVLEADYPKRLSYTFQPLHDANKRNIKGAPVDDAGEAPSRVTFEIEMSFNKVKLTLVHDQIPPDSKVLQGVRHGWPAILSSLKSLLETGEALFPNWR